MSRPQPDPMGTIGFARRPPRHRRWMASSYGNNMSLGNVSFLGALRYCVIELLRGNGPCGMRKWGSPPCRLDVIRGRRR